MAGHSKWANIKHKKAKEDAKKGKVFTRLIRELTVAAREGGGDPTGNPKLRLLIDKARAANMPQDNIMRAIKRGTGELGGTHYEAVCYEGYAPFGVAVLIETLTDNKNRTVSDLRHLFLKFGGKLVETGAVGWMFERKGVVLLKAVGHSEDEILEKLLDYNIEDVSLNDNLFTVYCGVGDLDVVKEGAEKVGFEVESAEIEWVAKDPISLSNTEEEKVYKFLEAIEDLDDVRDVYANLK